jgi:hypothetical protein
MEVILLSVELVLQLLLLLVVEMAVIVNNQVTQVALVAVVVLQHPQHKQVALELLTKVMQVEVMVEERLTRIPLEAEVEQVVWAVPHQVHLLLVMVEQV